MDNIIVKHIDVYNLFATYTEIRKIQVLKQCLHLQNYELLGCLKPFFTQQEKQLLLDVLQES